MQSWLAGLVCFVAMAGCLGGSGAPAGEPSPVEGMPAEGGRTARPSDELEDEPVVPRSPGAGDVSAPLLLNVTAELRDAAAEIVVPPGEFHVVRLIYDKEVWAEPEPWDGEAEVYIGMAYDLPSEGVFMSAFGFKPPAFVDDKTIRPYVTFAPLQGQGSARSWTWTSCSGDCGYAPAHESAMLIGGPEGAILRIGILSPDGSAEELWDRATIAVGADAGTHDAFAGHAIRVLVLASETTLQGGILQAAWSDAVAPGVSVQRTSEYQATANAREPGIFSASLMARETAGAEQWSYSLTAPRMEGGWDGAWVHDPQYAALYLTLTGAVYPPIVAAQGNIGSGPVHFEATRTFTSVSDPTGLGSLSYELVSIGHAGIDLDALFGWDTSRQPSPNAGFLHCSGRSAEPNHQTCVGTPSLVASAPSL